MYTQPRGISFIARSLILLILVMPAVVLIYVFPYDVDSFITLLVFKAIVPCMYIGIAVFGMGEKLITLTARN